VPARQLTLLIFRADLFRNLRVLGGEKHEKLSLGIFVGQWTSYYMFGPSFEMASSEH
jgi:hypothetical protein